MLIIHLKNRIYRPGVVAHGCNPRYGEGRDQWNHALRPTQGKSSKDFISTNKNLYLVACTCHPSYVGSIN
jgi:hypothetical protein